MAVLDRMILPLLNHLLQEEQWARERLRPFAGAFVRIEAGSLSLVLYINEGGCFENRGLETTPSVTLTLPSDAPVKFLIDRQSLFASVKLAGLADLAEALAFVFRNLRWDVESEMARWLGDIPARRLALFGARAGVQVQDSLQRGVQNIAEYATEDSGLLASAREISALGEAVDDLRNDAARLEKRISRLSLTGK